MQPRREMTGWLRLEVGQIPPLYNAGSKLTTNWRSPYSEFRLESGLSSWTERSMTMFSAFVLLTPKENPGTIILVIGGLFFILVGGIFAVVILLQTPRLLSRARRAFEQGDLNLARQLFSKAALKACVIRMTIVKDPLEAAIDGLAEVYQRAGMEVDLSRIRQMQQDLGKAKGVDALSDLVPAIKALPDLPEEVSTSVFESMLVQATKNGSTRVLANHRDNEGGGWILTDQMVMVGGGSTRWCYTLNQATDMEPIDRSGIAGGQYSVGFMYEGTERQLALPSREFQFQVLDAYIATLPRPYPGGEICWFCSTAAQAEGKGVDEWLHKVLDKTVTGVFGGTRFDFKYQAASVTVPRCDACANFHKELQRRHIWSGASLGIGIGFLIHAVFSNATNPPEVLRWWRWAYPLVPVISLILAVAFIGFSIWYYLESLRKLQRSGIRAEDKIRMYPRILSLWEQGYRPGAKPTA